MSAEAWNVRKVIKFCADDFAQRGLPSPRLDAELVVGHALSMTRVKLYMELDKELTPEELAAIRALIQRRRKHEPVAYLTGTREFWGRPFHVSAAVLIPRPDTETLVERALELLGPAPRKPRVSDRFAKPLEDESAEVMEAQREFVPGVETVVVEAAPQVVDASAEATPSAPVEAGRRKVLDLCTGSGCIGLTLALERDVDVTLTDVSSDALAVAKKNAESIASTRAERLHFAEGSLFAALASGLKFDLIASNPPYLAAHEMNEIDKDVRDHEPTLALVGGEEGTELIARIVREAPKWLAKDGTLLIEMGPTQGEEVSRLFKQAGFAEVRVLQDLGGRERVVEGRWVR
jgi:release factor glutamine methyltransferase